MATLATHLVTAEEFLGMEFETDCRFELDNGVVRMMGGGTARHARIQANLLTSLARQLKGSGCEPFGPDMGLRNHRLSVRYPDVTVYCGRSGPENDKMKAFDDPKMVIEVLSPSTRTRDIEVKLPEYRAMESIEAILYVDPDDESMHLETRDSDRNWTVSSCGAGGELTVDTLNLALTGAEVFARS
jgi:Uma2 family endonuclease